MIYEYVIPNKGTIQIEAASQAEADEEAARQRVALRSDAEQDGIQKVLSKADADITAAEFKTVMLRLARRILAKGG